MRQLVLIVAAMQCGPIVRVGVAVIGLAGWIVGIISTGAGPAQRWLGRALGIGQAALVLDTGQASLYVVKL